MGHTMAMTPTEAEALREARFRFRVDSISELLRSALHGDEAALMALRGSWPTPTEAEIAWSEISKLRAQKRIAARKLDSEKHARLVDEIELLQLRHPQCPRREYRVRIAGDVFAGLMKLAEQVPRHRPGRVAAVDGIKLLVNGYEADNG